MSSGRVHITGGLNAYTPLHFEPGYLNELSFVIVTTLYFYLKAHSLADVAVLRWAYKRAREYSRRMDVYRGELELGHPQFPKDSAAAVGLADGPVDIFAPDIIYSEDDDKIIDTYHRENGSLPILYGLAEADMFPSRDNMAFSKRDISWIYRSHITR